MEWKSLLEVSKISDKRVESYDGIKKYIATGDVNVNEITGYEEVEYNNKPSRADRSVEEGEIIFAKMKATTKVLVIDKYLESDYIFSTGFTTLKPSKDISINFLYHVILSDKFQRDKDKLCTGATQKAINNANLKKIKIPIPPLEIQEIIVEVLEKSQELVDKRKEQIESLDKLKEGIFYQMFGDPVLNDKEWEVKELGEICKMKSGGTPSRKNSNFFNGNIPWITTTALNDTFIDENDAIEFITEEAISKSATKIIPKDSVLIGTRVGVGKVSINTVDICTNQDIVALLGLDNNFNLFFIQQLLIKYKSYLQSKQRGATIKGINMSVLRSLKIPLPPLDLQKLFAEKVQAIEKQKDLLEKSLALMEENHMALMDRAFEGDLFP